MRAFKGLIARAKDIDLKKVQTLILEVITDDSRPPARERIEPYISEDPMSAASVSQKSEAAPSPVKTSISVSKGESMPRAIQDLDENADNLIILPRASSYSVHP